MNSVIRLAVPADVPDMAEVLCRSWEVAYRDIIPAEFIHEKNSTRLEQYRQSITDDNSTQYVIQENRKTIGIMWVAPSQDDDMGDNCYDVHAIYLHPDYSQQGIGTQAMEFAFDIARNLGKTIITVWVLKENLNSVRFCEKCGFLADGKVKEREYGKALLIIRMRKDL